MKGPEFYDAVFSAEKKYSVRWDRSPFSLLYETIARCVPDKSVVLDLGCGTGQLAECLWFFRKFRYLVGLDFSKTAVEMAAERFRKNKHASFFVQDIAGPLVLPACDVVVLSEVLEHIDNDLDVILNIDPLTDIVFSVPNYGSEAHVRHFDNENAIIERYGRYIFFQDIITVKYEDNNCHFICKGMVYDR